MVMDGVCAIMQLVILLKCCFFVYLFCLRPIMAVLAPFGGKNSPFFRIILHKNLDFLYLSSQNAPP